jgi:hypothetical protein
VARPVAITAVPAEGEGYAVRKYLTPQEYAAQVGTVVAPWWDSHTAGNRYIICNNEIEINI